MSKMDFDYLPQEFSNDLLELIKQKGVCPYEYMDSFKTFSEDRLPDNCDFFSFLKDEFISEKDYLHAINAWNMFNFHYLYLEACFVIG